MEIERRHLRTGRRARMTRPALRSALVGIVGTALAIATLASLPDVGGRLAQGFAGLERVRLAWIGIAAVMFFAMLVAMACAWRVAVSACGSTLTRREACARYGIGSLVNTFAPFRLGDAARVAAFARALDDEDGVWVAGGALGAIEAARVVSVVLLIVIAWSIGAVPLAWLGLASLILAALAGVVRFVAVRRPGGNPRVARLLTAVRELAKAPRDAVRLFAALEIASASRVLAAVSVCLALKVASPVVAGLLLVVALELSGQLQLTPANIGITNGTVAIALTARGIGLDQALTVGFALQAVETLVGIVFGSAGVIALAADSRAAVRRWFPIAVGVAGCVAFVTVASLGVLGDFS